MHLGKNSIVTQNFPRTLAKTQGPRQTPSTDLVGTRLGKNSIVISETPKNCELNSKALGTLAGIELSQTFLDKDL